MTKIENFFIHYKIIYDNNKLLTLSNHQKIKCNILHVLIYNFDNFKYEISEIYLTRNKKRTEIEIVNN